jgi:SnoaL-like protein
VNEAKSPRRRFLEAQVRTYFEGCNEGSREKMASVFAPSIVHYFPPGMFGPVVGSDAIADLWRRMIGQAGSRWTIDRIVSDEQEIVIEWTHFQPKNGTYIRGAEWYEFDEDGLITVIKAYYASPRDRALAANELDGYPYAALGYPMTAPDEAPSLDDDGELVSDAT